jgi:hypothetical protein
MSLHKDVFQLLAKLKCIIDQMSVRYFALNSHQKLVLQVLEHRSSRYVRNRHAKHKKNNKRHS